VESNAFSLREQSSKRAQRPTSYTATNPGGTDCWQPSGLPPLNGTQNPRVAAPLRERARGLMPVLHIDADQAWRIEVELGALHYSDTIRRCFTNRGYTSHLSLQSHARSHRNHRTTEHAVVTIEH
jgi:hypothetical protein